MSERGDVEGDDSPPLTLRRIVQRLPLYFALALAGIALVVILVTIQIYFGLPEFSDGWWGFVVFTGWLFWRLVRGSSVLWHRAGFWLIVVAFAVVHCAAFFAVLRAYPLWRPIWFAPIIGLEAVFSDQGLFLLFPEMRARTHHYQH